MNETSALVFDSVTIARRRRTLLQEVSFTVRRGSVHALIGHNGAGKTTLLRGLAGLVPLAGGAIRAGARAEVLLVGNRYPTDVTVRTIVDHHRRLRGSTGAVEAVDAVGVGEFLDRTGGALSTGMAQRLSIALALMSGAEILALDEPTTGLDPQGVTRLRELIGHMRDRGATVVMCSHDLAELELVCDEATFLRHGRLTASGSINEVARDVTATGHILRTTDDVRAAAMLAAHGIEVHPTARGLLVGQRADLETVIEHLRGQVRLHEVSVERGLFARLYDSYGSAINIQTSTRGRHR